MLAGTKLDMGDRDFIRLGVLTARVVARLCVEKETAAGKAKPAAVSCTPGEGGRKHADVILPRHGDTGRFRGTDHCGRRCVHDARLRLLGRVGA